MNNLQLSTNNNVNGEYQISPIGAKYIRGIRSSNYKYKTALAEQIDNSQDANATEVRIDFVEEKKNKMKSIIIVDNGDGMSYDQLKNSFCLGADRKYSKNDNGKFGMGGTNGALSMCAVKVTVTKQAGEYNIRKYDLDEVNVRDAWGSSPVATSTEYGTFFINLLDGYLSKTKSDSGTLIFMTNLDRMKNKSVTQVANVLKKQYGKTYYGALYTESLKIFINNTEVLYTDPLMWDHENTTRLIDECVVKPENGHTGIWLKAVSLYDHPSFKIQGKLGTSGGYVFRNNRLIESGIFKSSNWEGLWGISMDKRDIRWALYFQEDSDDMMNLSNSKDSVSPPADLVSRVSQSLLPWAKHYADLRNSRDKTQDKEESEKDLVALASMVTDLGLDESSNSSGEPRGEYSKKVETSIVKDDVDINYTTTKEGMQVVEESCGKYHGPLIIESHPDPRSEFKTIVKINIDNEFIMNHYNNKNAETKDAVRILLLSNGFSLYNERIKQVSDDLCAEVLENVESGFIDNLRRITRRQSL